MTNHGSNTSSSISKPAVNCGKDGCDTHDIGLNFVGVLPDEISLKIFSYLDVKSLCRSLQTCLRWSVFIEGCSLLWIQHCRRYQGLLPCKKSVFRKRSQWKAELRRVFVVQKVMTRWFSGEFSFPKTYDRLPGDHIQEMPVEVWGAILECEINRKKAQPPRTN